MSGRARYLVGDVHDALATLPDDSVDLVMTSPPFLTLRSYLPADHPDKAKEIGSEPTPADFLDTMLDVVESLDRVLAPHGSICFELGDTYSNSGGAGGDYNEGGMREGQARFSGSAAKRRTHGAGDDYRPERTNRGGRRGRASMVEKATGGHHSGGVGWPLSKSLTGIPTLFAWSLAYGVNLLRPERETPQWRIRNLIAWVRPNPPVGNDGDKFRAATSYLVVACKSDRRWFDLDAVRSEPVPENERTTWNQQGSKQKAWSRENGDGRERFTQRLTNPAGAPPLDWWEITSGGYQGAHYAVYPPKLCVRPVKAMCPERVCVDCGKPSWRITRQKSAAKNTRKSRGLADDPRQDGAIVSSDVPDAAEYMSVGWTCCGCGAGCSATVETGRVEHGWRWRVGPWNAKAKGIVEPGSCDGSHWRPGVVLDPFGGTGTTGVVATGHGRDAVLIDIDPRNADLALERLGMFLDVDDSPPRPAETVDTKGRT